MKLRHASVIASGDAQRHQRYENSVAALPTRYKLIAVMFSLSMSLFVAVTVVPVLCSRLLKMPVPVDQRRGVTGRLFTASERALNGLDNTYRALLHRALGQRLSVIGLATNVTLDPESPQYPWIDEGLVIHSVPTDNWNAIDPNIGFDADSMPWLSFGSFWDGIKMRRIDRSTGKLAAADATLYGLASRGGDAIEAPSIVYRDGYYYLFVSFDLCCRSVISTYNIRVGRSAHITGPYVDRDGVDMDRGGGTLLLETKDRFVGPGGQTVALDDGVYRMVNHYYDLLDLGIPKLQIHDLTWTNDGWPVVTTP